MTAADMGAARPHALLRPGVALPFLIVALIWGSTWYVIVGQIAQMPPAWAVAVRFAIAAPAMFALALFTGKSLALGAAGHRLALVLGLTQFCGNFNFVYRAELHLTSGIVAVLFALMIVTNALIARALIGERLTHGVLAGGALAMAGMALLLAHEARAGLPQGNVPLGALFALGGILAASLANVVQANRVGKALPMASLLAWAMLYGVGFNTVLGLALDGWPQWPASAAFWGGTLFLAILGSVVTFPLYYGVIRKIGAGRAAYQNILVIVVAMVISTVLEGYEWGPLPVAGAVLSLAGMTVALRARKG